MIPPSFNKSNATWRGNLQSAYLHHFPILKPIALYYVVQLAGDIDGSRLGNIEVSGPFANLESKSFCQFVVFLLIKNNQIVISSRHSHNRSIEHFYL